MKTVTELLDAARTALGVTTDAAFARELGVSRGTIANWKSGYSLPDTVMCATIAGLTGMPLAQVLGIVGEARAVSREEKAVWRKLAASVGVALIAVLATLPSVAHAATGAAQVLQAAHPFLGETLSTMHYAKYEADPADMASGGSRLEPGSVKL
jgi:transcriptional regulator with XRE-family HTH domain